MGFLITPVELLIIAIRSRFSFDVLFSIGQFVLALACLAVAGLWVGESLKVKGDLVILDQSVEVQGNDWNKMLSGPLGLRGSGKGPLALSLQQLLVLRSQSVRPDLGGGGSVFRVGVAGGDERIMKDGEPFFCSLTLHESGGVKEVRLDGGDVKLLPEFVDGRSVVLKGMTGDGVAFEVLLKAIAGDVASSGGCFADLEDAVCFGRDVFFEKYGGEQFAQLGKKLKLQVGEEMLFAGPGDFLMWEEGRWHVLGSVKDAKRDCPLAALCEGGEIEAWDAMGFLVLQKKVPMERGNGAKILPQQLISEPKLRTEKGVSCKIGKMRWVLKPGDWLLATETGMKRLKTSSEIEALLNHELRGELLIVDEIDDNGVLKGHFFDEMRTQIQPFSIHAVSSKGKKAVKRK